VGEDTPNAPRAVADPSAFVLRFTGAFLQCSPPGFQRLSFVGVALTLPAIVGCSAWVGCAVATASVGVVAVATTWLQQLPDGTITVSRTVPQQTVSRTVSQQAVLQTGSQQAGSYTTRSQQGDS
jgi:hypothetical protein